MDFRFLATNSQQSLVCSRYREGCQSVGDEWKIRNGPGWQVWRVEIMFHNRGVLYIVKDAWLLWANYEITQLDMTDCNFCRGNFTGRAR